MIVCRLFEYNWSSRWKLRMEVGNVTNAKKWHDQRAKFSHKPPMVFQHREKNPAPGSRNTYNTNKVCLKAHCSFILKKTSLTL